MQKKHHFLQEVVFLHEQIWVTYHTSIALDKGLPFLGILEMDLTS